jgi:HlyD family secretion protein
MQTAESGTNIKKRKIIIRNTGLIFLGVVLLLTFFSKTINNFLLPEVECTAPEKGNLLWAVSASGEVRALDRTKITAYGNWKVKDVMVDTSYEVTKGFKLAVIDEADVELSMKSAEVELSGMKNDLENYKNAFTGIDISAYEEEAQQAGKQAEREEDSYSTVKALYEGGSETYQDLKDDENRLEDAKADYARKLGAIDREKKENDKLKEEYDRNVKQKTMEIELKTLEYEKMMKEIPAGGIIKSPVNGIIRSVNMEKGSECTSGQVLFELTAKDSKFAVQFKLNAEKAELLKEGDRIELQIKADRDTQLYGYVLKKELLQNENMFLYTSNIVSDDSKVKILDGQSVELSADKGSVNYPFLLPNSSVTELGSKHYVFVLMKRDGILGVEYYVSKKEVDLVDHDDFRSSIKYLDSYDIQVVTFSNKVLEDGMQVKLSE